MPPVLPVIQAGTLFWESPTRNGWLELTPFVSKVYVVPRKNSDGKAGVKV